MTAETAAEGYRKIQAAFGNYHERMAQWLEASEKAEALPIAPFGGVCATCRSLGKPIQAPCETCGAQYK